MKLENGLVRFDFDPETGSIRQIADSATGCATSTIRAETVLPS